MYPQSNGGIPLRKLWLFCHFELFCSNIYNIDVWRLTFYGTNVKIVDSVFFLPQTLQKFWHFFSETISIERKFLEMWFMISTDKYNFGCCSYNIT